MTPEQKIKWAILTRFTDRQLPPVTSENIDDLYDELREKNEHWDAESDFRRGEVETELECDWSRHYESKAVAAKMPDGSWVGWTYWYGGGKHGEPGAVDWMDAAYNLDCKEEEKLVTVRTFTKR